MVLSTAQLGNAVIIIIIITLACTDFSAQSFFVT